MYSHLIKRIAEVLDLAIVQPPAKQVNKVYDIMKDQMPPLCLAFISSLLNLLKEPCDKPSTSHQIPRKVENLYKVHGKDGEFLAKHSLPNSCIVNATQSKTRNRSTSTSNDKEGRKLDVLQ